MTHGAGRHRPGPGGGGSRLHGGGFMGGDGFPAGRKLGSPDLQLVLLALLERAPAHGYELIRQLEERSGGFYIPSPGMIYPALTYLDEIGHAAVTAEGNRKLYAITPEGAVHLAAHRSQVDAILVALARIASRMDGVREAYAGVADADPQAADELHRARHALKSALMAKMGCAPDEARRIARILDETTARIAEKPV
jgi:DNA-binding PadR family transcriptional regulator